MTVRDPPTPARGGTVRIRFVPIRVEDRGRERGGRSRERFSNTYGRVLPARCLRSSEKAGAAIPFSCRPPRRGRIAIMVKLSGTLLPGAVLIAFFGTALGIAGIL